MTTDGVCSARENRCLLTVSTCSEGVGKSKKKKKELELAAKAFLKISGLHDLLLLECKYAFDAR